MEDDDTNWLPPGMMPWPNPCKRHNEIMPAFGPKEEAAELERQRKEAEMSRNNPVGSANGGCFAVGVVAFILIIVWAVTR